LVKRSISRDRDSVKSNKPGATTAGSERDLIPWHLAKRFEDRDKALARILKPVHTVGTQALESEIAAEDLSQPLRRRADTVLFDQYLEFALEGADPSVYQIQIGAHRDAPALSGNRG
jgi:hypothetical protein